MSKHLTAQRTPADARFDPIRGDVCSCRNLSNHNKAKDVVQYLALGRTAEGHVNVRCLSKDGSTFDIQVSIRLWSYTADGWWVHAPASMTEI